MFPLLLFSLFLFTLGEQSHEKAVTVISYFLNRKHAEIQSAAKRPTNDEKRND
ncbi:hypothetical protein B2K_39575 [Paenibacillus mucilaginosus K02]|uniref:Uncharacterized protein n=1 Tax=Paenibacillus mucilaginosus K02 TaxID=997761 RepID=R9ULJ5_9BACL|nr:hypothetical protein B2K_39575 [Paenibacillus mucilaginosus K02]